MSDFLARLKQRKLVQWAIAYVAFAFALIQVLDVVSDSYGWPRTAMHVVFGLLVLGFVVTVILAWYHGERGAQRVSGPELLLIALALVIGGGLLWHFVRAPAKTAAATVAASIRVPNAAQHSQGSAAPPVASTSASLASVASAIAAQRIPAKSVAVLPFENLSDDKTNEYFVAGMQDLILTKLADIGDLKVIARTSTMQYGSHPENLTLVGQQLGVATILEGSVQKQGNQVLINVQLIDARTDSHIWAESYQRTLNSIFGVEGEVAEKVADALNAKLTQAEFARVAAVPTRDPVAYDLYLKAQRISDEDTAQGWDALPAVIAAYQKVIQQDPSFALAYTQLAFSQLLENWTGMDRSRDVLREAEANVHKALALQPDLPQAHVVLGYVYRWAYDDYGKALAEYELAKRGLPNNANVAAAIGFIRATQGDTPAAIAGLQRATTLDPRNPHWPCQVAAFYSAIGNYVLARQALMRAFAVNPSFAEAYAYLSQVDMLESGDAAGALTLLNRAPAAMQASGMLVTARIKALLLQRNFSAARHYADQLRPGHGTSAFQVDQIEGNVLWLAGAHKDAAPFYTKALDLLKTQLPTTTRPFQTYADLAFAAARLGDAGEAREYGRRMIALAAQKGRLIPYDRGVEPWTTLASAYASQGDTGEAISALGKALTRNSGFWVSVPLLKIDPTWDPIRKDPAFQTLLERYANAIPEPSPGTHAGQE